MCLTKANVTSLPKVLPLCVKTRRDRTSSLCAQSIPTHELVVGFHRPSGLKLHNSVASNMSTFKKQFPTFRILYLIKTSEEKITPENFNKCYVEVDGPGGFTVIHSHELTYDLAVQLTSGDEAQVRDALDTILIHRKFIARELESILDSKLVSEYYK